MKSKEQILEELNNDVIQLVNYYDSVIDTIDTIVMRILKSRCNIKWQDYTISILKEKLKCDVAISKGLSSLYLDFRTPYGTYIPVSIEVASKKDEGDRYRIDMRVANYSWICARSTIEKERNTILSAIPNIELYYNTITALRELRKIEPTIPRVFWTLIK